jgi:hypothetical protein
MDYKHLDGFLQTIGIRELVRSLQNFKRRPKQWKTLANQVCGTSGWALTGHIEEQPCPVEKTDLSYVWPHVRKGHQDDAYR